MLSAGSYRSRFFALVLSLFGATWVMGCPSGEEKRRSDSNSTLPPTSEGSGKAPREEPQLSKNQGVAREGRLAPKLPEERLLLDVVETQKLGGLRGQSLGAPIESAERIIVLFHGYGAEGDDLVPLAQSLLAALPQSDQSAFVLPAAPFVRPAGGRAWFKRDRSNFEEGLEWSHRSVLAVLHRNPHAKVVIGGFSQGAMLTLNLLRDAPKNLAAAVLLSPAELIIRDPAESSRRPKVFLSHGTRDRVLPFSGSIELKARLQAAQYEVNWVQFEGRHAIPFVVRRALVDFIAESFAATAFSNAPSPATPSD